jgi:N-acetylgalactosamine kinase
MKGALMEEHVATSQPGRALPESELMSSQAAFLRPVQQWIRAVQEPDSGFNRMLLAICAHRETLHREAARMCLRTLETFGRVHGPDRPVLVIRSAGRVNILGTHIDHRGGSVNPIAVNHMWLVAAPREDDWVVAGNVESGSFPEQRFRIRACLPAGQKIRDWDSWCNAELQKRNGDTSATWSNYIRGAVLYLQNLCTNDDGSCTRPLQGMDMVFYGDIPRAVGLSSSSAIVVATAEAVVRLNALEFRRSDLVGHCGLAEWYVGTRGGNSDHAAILFAQPNAILHVSNFPLNVESSVLSSDYSLVLASSGIEARKQASVRSAFNSRVAAYIFGFLLVKQRFPEYAERLQYLRDVNPDRLGVAESRIYEILRCLPISAGRAEILRWLPEQEPKIARVFRSHDEPPGGYPIRQVCLYGVAECIRADMVLQCLKAGDVRRFGELMNLSHDGDRVIRLVDGARVPTDNRYPDERLDALIRDLASGDPQRIERSQLWRQPGGYNVSVPEVDTLVDIALATPGVVGAGLVGAGMGGCIVAVVEAPQARHVIENMAAQYYGPRNLPVAAQVVTPVGGLHTFEL